MVSIAHRQASSDVPWNFSLGSITSGLRSAMSEVVTAYGAVQFAVVAVAMASD